MTPNLFSIYLVTALTVTYPLSLAAQNKVPIHSFSGLGKDTAIPTVDGPHWGNGIDCSSCHILHKSPDTQLTSVEGNANLCMSCHNPAGVASNKPFSNANRAVPGISGTSHAWDVPAINPTHGGNIPTDPEMLRRLHNGNIACSTCHNQHDQTFSPFLRKSNYQNGLCKDCHSIRDVGSYKTSTANKGSHPVGIPYPFADSLYFNPPLNLNLPLLDPNNVECTTCHQPHYADSGGANSGAGDGYILRAANDSTLCKSCHTFGEHKGMGCRKCHQPHDPNRTNIFLVKEGVSTPNSGNKSVVFLSKTGPNSFADGNSTYDGICEVCHTQTAYHRNNSTGYHQHQPGQKCTSCHQHKDNFLSPPCDQCHNQPQDNGDNIPPGGRRAIAAEFNDTSHHLQNVAFNKADCRVCHEMTKHMQGRVRLFDRDTPQTVYELTNRPMDDQSEANKLVPFCLNCHDGDGDIPFTDGITPPFVDAGLWNNAAHKLGGDYGTPLSCMGDGQSFGCHATGHGSSNIKILNAPSAQSLGNFCFNCHTEGKVPNNAISGSGLADDIEQAFGFSSANKHDLGGSFTIGSDSFTLECTTCHNPHIASGQYWEANQNKSPVTRPDFSDPTNNPRAMGTTLWGDQSGEKMDDYGGKYKTPNGDIFSGSQLPDYVTFCNDCHTPMPDPGVQPGSHGNIGFDSDPHGLGSANSPNGGGTPPDWYSAGKGRGWNGDDRTSSDPNDWWPVIIRGRGDQLWSRKPYNHEERIAGANFALSCTDCHEAHGSGVSSMIRSNPNSGTGTIIWNTMCNNCHYYYSDWHAGMSCGNASCHVSSRMGNTGTNTIHRMSNQTGTGATRGFDFDRVLYLKLNGNFNDSGTWRMHGKWFDGAAGSFTSGKFGQAIQLNGNQTVQVGTRNSYWSTDEGKHGTWKYTEIKFNATLESWVYPTDASNNEYSIFTKHVGYNDGGYALTLSKIDGALRLTFNAQIDNNGNSQGGASGTRGAYSSVAIPLNTWTHVAVTFDKNGPGRSSSDPSIGRIRIYVNGEDVTTSSSSGNTMQPGGGENSIYAYSENSPWNESICYNGQWCASEFSIGGFTWQNGFVGKIDEAIIWNITKNASYFESADKQSGPFISLAEGGLGSNQLGVTFSEETYSNTGQSGALQPSDFVLTDLDNSRTIVAVSHSAGQSDQSQL